MTAESRPAPFDGPWTGRAQAMDLWLREHKIVFSATTASLVSTFAGFPLDSLKSRLQSSREAVSLPRLAADVVREEGVGGLWRGFPLPLITISIVRTISFTIYTSTKRILNAEPGPSSGIDASSEGGSPPWIDLRLGLFNKDTAGDVAMTSLLAGGASGAVVCVGSAPFELVKVRRQLEYQIYRDTHPEAFAPKPTDRAPPPSSAYSQHPSGTSASAFHHHLSNSSSRQAGPASSASPSPSSFASVLKPKRPPPFVPPTTMQAVKMIIDKAGIKGLYTGWRLHFIRDTSGTALYFAEYDVMRYFLGRKRETYGDAKGKARDDGPDEVPAWARSWLPQSVVPFMCGSVAGVTSWALIYPIDAIKTKAQQRALSGLERRTPLTQFLRLVRGSDKDNPKPLLTGIARLYRGLGVSMVRSMLTHGLLWTIVDAAGGWIETRPFERLANKLEV
ncbi:mitochondrial carrier domain-containing protein [Papiliotrema laurentii]|uniref:Mitochondrial carrier domain-containing protein n=1 Tax=Papiliotrema laurentii TaxID=5418 RepID=A0AAD9CV79_PAPLA|nr:mitochondrial carrier domain-containing protein [Papiliotrema laurentii]